MWREFALFAMCDLVSVIKVYYVCTCALPTTTELYWCICTCTCNAILCAYVLSITVTNVMCVGVGTFLKSKNPNIKVVLADPQVNSHSFIHVGCTYRYVHSVLPTLAGLKSDLWSKKSAV